MKISRISTWQMDLPLTQHYSLSGGRLKFEKLDSTFIRIDTDEGISGWGESCPWGHTYLPAHGSGIRAAIEILAPAIIGLDPRSVDSVNRAMDVALPGHPYAKSALDIACWDILGKFCGLPLWQLFGGDSAGEVMVNSSIPTGTPEEMIAHIRQASAMGYRVHSAKIGGSNTAEDIERIEAITSCLSSDEEVTFDVNRAWTPATAIAVMNSVRTRDQSWFEQPCETLNQCAQVTRRTSQPVKLDECLHTYQDHLDAWRLGACEGIKIKPNRVGGLTKARRIRDLAVNIGWQVHIEDVGGTVLADTAAIHLAVSTADEYRLASWLCHYHLAIDPFPGQGSRNENGVTHATELPGHGVVPLESRLGDTIAVFQ